MLWLFCFARVEKGEAVSIVVTLSRQVERAQRVDLLFDLLGEIRFENHTVLDGAWMLAGLGLYLRLLLLLLRLLLVRHLRSPYKRVLAVE